MQETIFMDCTTKLALLVYRSQNGQAIAYILDLLQPYDPPWKLCSAVQAAPLTAALSAEIISMG